MKKMQSIVFAFSLVLVAPIAVQTVGTTLVPPIELQVGNRDSRGYYQDGDHWHDHGWWKQHYEWRGNRWYLHGPPSSPCRHKKASHDHHGGHGLGKHRRQTTDTG